MFTVELTSYGQTLVSSQVIIEGLILIYDKINDISSLTDISSYTKYLDEEACGNINKSVGNVRIYDVSAYEYQAKTILFYITNNNEKKIIAGYSQDSALVQKNGGPLTIFLSFDFSVFTHGFLFSSIQSGYGNASHNIDGIVHIENPEITTDDAFSVYSKLQTDALIADATEDATNDSHELIMGTQSASVAAWTGVSKRSALYNGMTINYFLPYAGKANSTLNLTLANGSTTGAIPIYFRGATAVGTHFPVGSLIQLTYLENITIGATSIAAGWFAQSNYVDGNTTTYLSAAQPLKAGTNGIFGRSLVMRTGIDTWESIVLSYKSALAQHVLNTQSGFYTDTIFYNAGTSTVTSGNNSSATMYPVYNTITYTNYFLDTVTTPFVVGKPIYFVGTIHSDGKFYFNSPVYHAQEITTSDIYVFVGLAYSSTTLFLLPYHPMFTLKNGKIVEVTTHSLEIESNIPQNVSDLNNDAGYITSSDIPTNVSVFTNDAGYLTSYTETDPTVPSWAKQQNKPTYTAQEVGALPDNTPIPEKTSDLINDSGFITSSDIPTNVSAFTNDAGYLTSFTETDPTVPSWAKASTKPTYTASEVGALPDDTFIPSNTTDLTNDAEFITASDIPSNVSAFTNDSGYLTSYTETDPTVPSWAKQTNKPSYTLDEVTDGTTRKLSDYVPTSRTINSKALTSNITLNLDDVADGTTRKLSDYVPITRTVNSKALSSNITLNLDDISDGTTRKLSNYELKTNLKEGAYVDIDETTMTASSENLPTSKAVAAYISGLNYATVSQLPTVNNATLTIKKNTDDTGTTFTANASQDVTANLGLHTVATSGSYNDLSNKPTIPTVNNAKLTIQRNGTQVAEFTANADSPVTANIEVPILGIKQNTTTLTPDVNKIVTVTVPTTVSELSDSENYELKSNLKEGAYVDVDETTMTSLSDNLPTSKAVASYISMQGFLTQHQSLDGQVASAQYNSTDKTIEFYNASGTKLNTDIDATDFIKDGMIDTVEVTGGNLVITFNTDAGKEDIEIPITDIFDADDYYTKDDIDGFGFLTEHQSLDNCVQKVASTDNAITRFDGTGGAIQNSGVLIDESNNLLLPLGSSSTFANNAKLAIGNAWFGSNTTGGLAYGTKSGSTYTSYYTFETTAFRPVSGRDNTIDIGTSQYRWKQLYLGTAISNGTYTYSLPSATGTLALTSQIPSNVSSLTNDSGYLKSSDLSEGAFVDVDETTTTSTSDNLTTGKAVASYISSLNLATQSQIPTVNNAILTIKKNNNDTGTTFTANADTDVTANLGLHAVATSGSYNDLTNKPTIPTVNNATLTIQKNGTTVNTFTANASSPVTANITVPTTVVELSDSSDYVTQTELTEAISTPIIQAGNNISVSYSSSLIPSGYTQVEYITSTGSSYINTNIPPTDTTKVIIDAYTTSTGSFYLFGARATSSSTILFGQSGSATGSVISASVNGTSLQASTNGVAWTRLSTGQRYTIGLETNSGTFTYCVKDHTNSRYFEGTANYTLLGTQTTKIMLCAFNSSNILTGTTQIYQFEIYQNDTLAFKGIPCIRQSDGKYGLYDTVSESFFASVSSTSFYGSDKFVGTVEISSIDNKAVWGNITGTLSNQTDLNTALGLKANSADLATVASSGDYTDLTNTPTNVSTFTNDAGYLTEHQSLSGYVQKVANSTDNAIVRFDGSNSDIQNSLTKVHDDGTVKLPASRNTDAIDRPKFSFDTYWVGSEREGFVFGTEANLTDEKLYSLFSDAFYPLQKSALGTSKFLWTNLYLGGSIYKNTYQQSLQSKSGTIALTSDIPTNVSAFTNDAGYLTSFTETDPTVPSWAKEQTKPSYTLDEVTDGTTRKLSDYVPTTRTVNSKALSSNITLNLDDVADGTNRSIPTNTNQLTNDAGFITSSDLPTNHVTTDTAQEITGAKTIAEDKLKIGNTSSNEDIDDYVFKRGQEFIVGTQSSSTSLWKGTTVQHALYEGMCVNYFVPVASTSTTASLELTFPDNTTSGAIPVIRNAGSTVTSTHIGVGAVVQLTLLLNRTVGSTLYEKVWRMNEWYDSNTNSIGYQLRTNSTTLTCTDRSRYYKIFFMSVDNTQWVPASSHWTNDATASKTVNQRPINPFGRIVYTSASTNYTAGSNIAAGTIWDQYALTLGHSFNPNGGKLDLVPSTPVYVKCAPQANGSAIIDATTPIVQSLPSSNDGKIYIFLGVAYGGENNKTETIELCIKHPIYYHDGTCIRIWPGKSLSKLSDFTNDVGYITESGSITGNAGSASKLKLLGNNTDTSYPLVFTESVNTSTTTAVSKSLYTDSFSNHSLKYNPNTNICYCDKFNGSFELPSTAYIRFFSNATNFFTNITQGQYDTQAEIFINGYDSENTRQSVLCIANDCTSSGTSSIFPYIGNWSLGTTTKSFDTAYIKNIYVNGTILSTYIAGITVTNATNATNATIANTAKGITYVPSSGTSTELLSATSATTIEPSGTTETKNLGSSSKKFGNVYAKTFYGANLGNSNNWFDYGYISIISSEQLLADRVESGINLPLCFVSSAAASSANKAFTTTSYAHYNPNEYLKDGDLLCIYFINTNTATSPYITWNNRQYTLYRDLDNEVGNTVATSWRARSFNLFMIYSGGSTYKAILLNHNTDSYSTASATNSNNILPSTNSTSSSTGYDLGSTSYHWRYVYSRYIGYNDTTNNYIGSSSYSYLYGLLTNTYSNNRGSIQLALLHIKNTSSTAYYVARYNNGYDMTISTSGLYVSTSANGPVYSSPSRNSSVQMIAWYRARFALSSVYSEISTSLGNDLRIIPSQLNATGNTGSVGSTAVALTGTTYRPLSDIFVPANSELIIPALVMRYS